MLPATSIALAVRLWLPSASVAVAKRPGAAAIGGRRADLGGAVEHLHRAAGFRRAGQRQRIVVGDAVADHAAVGRERGHGRGARGDRVDGDIQRRRGGAVLPAASIALAVKAWLPSVSVAVVKVQAPLPLAVAVPDLGGAVEDLHRGRPPPCRSASAYCRW